MVVLTTPTFDPDGRVVITESGNSRLGDVSRRVMRTATLDGGAVLSDFGYSDADRTIVVVANMAVGVRLRLQRLMRLYNNLVLTSHEGIFTGTLSSISVVNGKTKIKYLVLERIA